MTDEVGDKGLKKDAIGFLDGLVIGISSTAPAYSLAAVLAIVVVGVGVQAPAVMLLSFIPMFLIASSFFYMNRADPDWGTTFSWITRAMGPRPGMDRRLGGHDHGHPRDRLARAGGGVLHVRPVRRRWIARLHRGQR